MTCQINVVFFEVAIYGLVTQGGMFCYDNEFHYHWKLEFQHVNF